MNNRKKSGPGLVVLATMLIACFQASGQQIIKPISIVEDSGSYSPVTGSDKLIDDQNLSVALKTGAPIPDAFPFHDGNYRNMWLSNGKELEKQFIVFDLGGLYRLQEVVVWPFVMPKRHQVSVRTFDLYVSEGRKSGGLDANRKTWLKVGTFTLQASDKARDVLAQPLKLEKPVQAQLVMLDVLSNHSASDAFAGLAKVRFIGEEPKTQAAAASLIVPVVADSFPPPLKAAASALLNNDFAEALRQLAADSDLDSIQEAHAALKRIAGINQFILDSFKEDIGKTIPVEISNRRMQVKILEVTSKGVKGERKVETGAGVGSTGISFSLSHLSSRERLRRAARAGRPVFEMYRGLLALRSKRVSSAARYFEASQTELGKALLDQMQNRKKGRMEEAARASWKKLQAAGRRDLNPKEAQAVLVELEKFQEAYGETDWSASIQDSLSNLLAKTQLAATENFVENGGFESGEISPWKIVSGDNAGIGATIARLATDNPYKGSHAAHLLVEGGKKPRRAAYLSQAVKLPEKAWFRAGVRARFPTVSNGNTIHLRVLNGEEKIAGLEVRHAQNKKEQAEWQLFQTLFFAETKKVEIQMRGAEQWHHTTKPIFLDDVQINRFDPPKGVPKDAMKFAGHHYKLFPVYVSWSTAKKYCEALGGHLLTINRKVENTVPAKLMDGFEMEGKVHLGLAHQGKNVYTWVTGEEMSYENFGGRFKAEPQHAGEYVVMRVGKKNDKEAGQWRHGGRFPVWFICEWDE